ncbi:MAG TPA: glycosyltransferase family 4 protein [Polyangiales bacterium]|nr:glycosyltransferase family 4 protein [Polyangiales bacterium]
MRLLFVTPPLDGPATGGTLYNRQLIAALEAHYEDISLEHRTLDEVRAMARVTDSHDLEERAEMASGHDRARANDPPVAEQHGAGLRGVRPDQVWVDSLYLSELPDMRARFDSETRVGLLLHYLPSLLGNPVLHTAAELSTHELRALRAADLIVTPSEYLKQLVEQICPGKRCACVTPGVQVSQPGGASARDGTALMICNVTENKGVLPFLRELAQVVPPTTTFDLAIAGELQLEAAYARECLAQCEQHAWLREHVRFLGSVTHAELFTRLAHASVLVSASRMESYGMALAEARALGTPILALPGGNIAHHVAADSGGQLASAPRGLAHALCALMADPSEQAARLARARRAATIRPWRAAAADFVAQHPSVAVTG